MRPFLLPAAAATTLHVAGSVTMTFLGMATWGVLRRL